MPFKSEKQRRFLWAEHPDIAKRWAKEYPESNKHLPMYADSDTSDSDSKKKDAEEESQIKKKAADFLTELKSALPQIDRNIGTSVKNCNLIGKSSCSPMYRYWSKFADSKQERVDIPHSSEPTYAGEERAKGKQENAIPLAKNVSGDNAGVNKRQPENAINSLLQKISAVLAPAVEQTMENLQAEREGRVPRRVGKNRGIKRYSQATPTIPLPIGMQQPQGQQPLPANHNHCANSRAQPVGGGSNPQFNPINAFGAISATGNINGNAAFGAKNSPDSSKLSCWLRAKLAENPVTPANTGPAIPDWIDAKYHEGLQGAPGGRKYMYFPHADNLPEAGGKVVETETGRIVQSNIPDREAYFKYLQKGGNANPKPMTFGAPQAQTQPQKAPAKPAAPATPATPKPAAPTPAAAQPAKPAPIPAPTPAPAPAVKPPVPAPNTGAMSSQPIPIKQAARSEILGKITSIDANDEDIAYWEEEFADELAGYQKAAKDNKTTPCSCGCGDTISTCKCSSSCSCKKPGGSCYKPKEKDADMVKYSLEDVIKLARCWAGYEPVPGKAPYSNDSCRPVGSGKKKKKENKKSESEKSSALGLWDRIRAKRERGEKPAKRGDKDYPDAKSWKKVTGISEKKAGTPAWQRSEGKNEEGGLNEKGRKSYEREHGGNLKAPVTQKNPKGEAKKRQNSFCARMCGMKRVNTGSKTKNDPDSRINKSLRKWNCKCSSAMEFGMLVGQENQENQKNQL